MVFFWCALNQTRRIQELVASRIKIKEISQDAEGLLPLNYAISGLSESKRVVAERLITPFLSFNRPDIMSKTVVRRHLEADS